MFAVRLRRAIAKILCASGILAIQIVGQDCNQVCPAGGIPANFCESPPCPSGWPLDGQCCCMTHTPIVIDVDESGFSFTSLGNGVEFDIADRGRLAQVSWTGSASTNAWLALDRNGNGMIDNGSELFGDVTAQPPPPKGQSRNGFLALAVFDLPENGGNGDGVIDDRDEIYPRLLLWQDKNHDGRSSPGELKTLRELGIKAISMEYEEVRRTDQYGNLFRYRAKVYSFEGSSGRWAYDVILLIGFPVNGTPSGNSGGG